MFTDHELCIIAQCVDWANQHIPGEFCTDAEASLIGQRIRNIRRAIGAYKKQDDLEQAQRGFAKYEADR